MNETTQAIPISPFLSGAPNVQWAWDSTSLGWLKECPRKYYYHMIEGWSSRHEAIHLEFGILYHRALETYERLRIDLDHDEAVKEVVRRVMEWTWRDGKPWRSASDLPPDDKATLKCREYLVRTVVWYLDTFRKDPAQTKVSINGPMIELHFQFDIDFSYNMDQKYALCGYLDRVVTFQGETFVMDRKTTTTTLGGYYFDQYDPDNQMSLYTVAAQVAFHTPVKGVIVDAAQIAVGFSRFVRHFIFKTPDQIKEWLDDTKFWLRLAERFAEANRWPMNDKSCHKFGGCVFRKVCSKSPSVRDRFLESDFVRRKWNPLEIRNGHTDN